MTPGRKVDESWMWHPSFSEERKDTAGLFVHFHKTITLEHPPSRVNIRITADTRYKLYVNKCFVSYGPVKGDRNLWFYDDIDIGPYLHAGENDISVVVLRFFYSTKYAPSFPRLERGGLRIIPTEDGCLAAEMLRSASSWKAAIDPWTTLRIDEPEDDFLHVYQYVNRRETDLKEWEWVNVETYKFAISTGNSAPWNLATRMIPPMSGNRLSFKAVHNVRSSLSDQWLALSSSPPSSTLALRLPSGSTHQLDLEAPEHVTAFVKLRFGRCSSPSRITLMYSESYEDKPRMVPYLRSKGNRLDYGKSLYGPKDIFDLQGTLMPGAPTYDDEDHENEMIIPFHWRAFRFIRLFITVGSDDLIFRGIEMETANYPLETKADVCSPDDDSTAQLWTTSIRTLKNCMHDCYEDCPFYEQLQYAMDTRSSILFTYYCSGDDRLARQAITQIHNTFQPTHGLTASRAPSHRRQHIPHFSLYWILMLCDHLSYFDDKAFIREFLPVIDAVLYYFERRVDPSSELVISDQGAGVWNFVDWAESWRPYGIPPTAERTRVSTYTNMLYIYTLKSAAVIMCALDRPGIAKEYLSRADRGVRAVRKHCFDGTFFTDSLASEAESLVDYSHHSQVWAVLSGAVGEEQGRAILGKALDPRSGFIPTSISMSFYTLRALSNVGGGIYNGSFHRFWDPWREQLALGMTTWEEDSVSQRSDCHAWGSSPIHEFITEVAGLRPAKAGWSAISFRPRIGLYSKFSATVPIGRGNGEITGMISVSWETAKVDKTVSVSLRIQLKDAVSIPVYVDIPGESIRRVDSAAKMTFQAKY